MEVVTIIAYILFLVGMFLISYIGVTLYYEAKHDEQKYRLYRIRDKVVRLRIEDKIDEKLFNKLYQFINDIIVSVDNYDLIKLRNIIRKAESLPKREIKNPYVREVLEELAETIMQIIIENSLLLRVIILIALFKELKELMKVGFLSRLPQILVYREIKEFQEKVSGNLSYS